MSTYIHATVTRLFIFLVSVVSLLFYNHPHNCDWIERSKGETTGWMPKETDRKTMKIVVTHASSMAILDATLLDFDCED